MLRSSSFLKRTVCAGREEGRREGGGQGERERGRAPAHGAGRGRGRGRARAAAGNSGRAAHVHARDRRHDGRLAVRDVPDRACAVNTAVSACRRRRRRSAEGRRQGAQGAERRVVSSGAPMLIVACREITSGLRGWSSAGLSFSRSCFARCGCLLVAGSDDEPASADEAILRARDCRRHDVGETSARAQVLVLEDCMQIACRGSGVAMA